MEKYNISTNLIGVIKNPYDKATSERREAERRWLSTGPTIHKQVYNAAKRHATTLVQAAKTSFFSTKIMESKSSKQLLNITNQLASRKKSSALPTVQLHRRFADFFLSKVQTIRHNLDNQAQLVCFGESEEQSCSRSSFRPVSEDDVRKMILKSSPKSCELDPMPTFLLFECIDEVVPAITHVVNEYFLSGTFPSMFKTAIVKPLLKKPSLDQDRLKNYRPVSNLSFLSKVAEKLVLSQQL